MYFVVFLNEPKINVVIPCTWIQGPTEHLWDKFVNRGLNHCQVHLCYWASENSIDYFGYPGVAVAPDFTVPRATAFPCHEGTYTCHIVHFRADYSKAQEFCERRRNVVPGIYNERRVYEHPIPVINNETEQRPDAEEDDEDMANRSASPQFDNQIEFHEIEDNAINDESPLVKEEVVISNRSIYEITEMLNDVHDDTRNESIDPLATSVSNHTEVFVPNENGSACVVNVFDPPTTSTRTVTAIPAANDGIKKYIIEIGSGSWLVEDMPTTLPGTIATPIDFDANVQDVAAHANHPAENEDDATITSNGPVAAIHIGLDANGHGNIADANHSASLAAAIDVGLDANGLGSVAHANVSIGSENATSHMPTQSTGAIGSDADIEETVITFYDSDDEPLQMSFMGTKFPTVYPNPLPVTFVKRENDLISGDKPYEEVDVSETDIHFSRQYFSFSFFFLLFRRVGSILPANKSSQL